jgi:hypothetical protein
MTLLVAAFGIWFSISHARADAIDRMMVLDSDAIIQAIRGLGAKNVAVLKFEAKVGPAAPTFEAGTINVQMIRRIENLLVMTNDTKNPQLNLLVEAGRAAATLAHGTGPALTWKTPEGRKELFKLKLPLAWDESQRFSPDAFVTGTVVASSDMKETRIVLRAFTRQNPAELKTIGTIAGDGGSAKGQSRGIHTDRVMLASMGQSFVLSRRLRGRSFETGDDAAADVAAQLNQSGQQPTVSPDAPVKLDILLGGQPVAVDPDPISPGEGKVRLREGLAAGKELAFRVTNTGPEPVGALLAVNGRNTAAMDNEDITSKNRADCRTWVLKPGQSYTVRGFYTDAQTGRYEPCKVLTAEESVARAASLDTHLLGVITLDVFGKGAGLSVTHGGGPADAQKIEEQAEAELTDLTAGGDARSLKVRGLAELKARKLALARGLRESGGKLSFDVNKQKVAAARKLRSRGLDNLIEGDASKAASSGTIHEESLADMEMVMSYEVRYFERSVSPNALPQP